MSKRLSDSIEDFCFIDFETRAKPGAGPHGNVVAAGTYRYAKNAFPTILTYAIGNGPVQCLSLDMGFEPCYRFSLHGELAKFYARACERKAWFVAWKMSFDRAIWNHGWSGDRPLAPEMTVDAMCQALASNLPADLESAHRAVGGPGKHKEGKQLIGLFAPEDGATPQSHPAEWARFKAYAVQDIVALREVWQRTRPLPACEWEEYWASERINERGVAVDIGFCREAYALALVNSEWSNRRLRQLTGEDMRITMPQRIAAWVHANTSSAVAKSFMVPENADPSDEDDEEDVRPQKKKLELSLTRPIIRRMLNYLGIKEDAQVMEVLELREYGGSSSPVKFRKMVDQADDGRIKDQYVFNGAMQTGRFSSRGIQIHNLPRDSMGKLEEAAIADISLPIREFVDKYGSAGKALPRLIRPALIAPKGRTLVWCDWSNIEARVNPWLAGNKLAVEKLDVFRWCDAHPDQPDVYRRTAGDLIGCNPALVSDDQRQSHGKVPELSLGFGGATGALLSMASNYGVRLGEEQALDMVTRWRGANGWAVMFWDRLWEAIERAVKSPGTACVAGRVGYLYKPDYLGGALLCQLPGGRWLTYPQCHWEQNLVKDKLSGLEVLRWQLTYRKGHGRAAMWRGKACENVVQATAGSLLRHCLVALRQHETWMPVVAHTHDDIIVEVDEDLAEDAGHVLRRVMTGANAWNSNLPLAVEVKSHWYFSKYAGRAICDFTPEMKTG